MATDAERPTQPDLFPADDRERGGGAPSPQRRRARAPAPLQRADTGSVRVGTSGYSFADWVGSFYPPGTPRGGMLDHYQTRFRTVEINATYYRIPPPSTMQRMAERTSPDFEFMVKLPGELTHKRREIAAASEAFQRALVPLAEAGKLSGLLAQFPYAFHDTPESRRYLGDLRDALGPHPAVAEFRHASWDTPELRPLLESLGYGFCSVDEPDLPGLIPQRAFLAGETAYVRLHGRNAADWWGGGSERYNYLYSRPELEAWAGIVRDLAREARQTYVYFNNCHAGHAVVNARMLEDLLQTA
jgi:uncharacterized protein YecE (DUF72 family)